MSLVGKRGPELEKHYRNILEHLGQHPDTTIGTIFADAPRPDRRHPTRPRRHHHGPRRGTGGFLIAAQSCIPDHAVNMLLHGIGRSDGPSLIHVGDALAEKSSGRHATLVVANPPFGRKSAITVIGQDGEDEKEDIQYDRHDFTATTTNKQLNLLQRIMSLTPVGGRAAVVLPDNVLFEGGAGEKVPGRRARRSLGRHPWAVSAEDHLGRSEGLTVIRGYA